MQTYRYVHHGTAGRIPHSDNDDDRLVQSDVHPTRAQVVLMQVARYFQEGYVIAPPILIPNDGEIAEECVERHWPFDENAIDSPIFDFSCSKLPIRK